MIWKDISKIGEVTEGQVIVLTAKQNVMVLRAPVPYWHVDKYNLTHFIVPDLITVKPHK